MPTSTTPPLVYDASTVASTRGVWVPASSTIPFDRCDVTHPDTANSAVSEPNGTSFGLTTKSLSQREFSEQHRRSRARSIWVPARVLHRAEEEREPALQRAHLRVRAG